jgi:uncharacterized protein (DUF1778 family)
MAAAIKSDARLNFRLRADLKLVIEEAASQLGQSVSDFAISTLVRNARDVLHQSHTTELTSRDRDLFLSLLDDSKAKPNAALKAAVARYKKQVG